MSGCMAWAAQNGAGEFDVVSLFTAFLSPWCDRPASAQVSSSASTSGERAMVRSRTNASWLSSMLSWS
jgi:hypothetical protein